MILQTTRICGSSDVYVYINIASIYKILTKKQGNINKKMRHLNTSIIMTNPEIKMDKE